MALVLAVLLGSVGVLVLAIVGASAVGASRFRSRYQAERAELLRRAAPLPPVAVSPAPLPPPVQRYLELTQGLNQPRLHVAILQQRGALRAAADKPWMPFESEQVYSMAPPAFVWFARARVAPLFHMLARDKFVDGQGNMLVSLLGLFTVADGRGPEMDLGAGLRYWGEIIAFPEALQSPHLRWEPVDDRQARVTISQGALKMSATVEFDEKGFLAAVHAERYRDVNGAPVLTPWSGRMRGWKPIDGRLFPSSWESVWHLPEGDLTAVTMEILRVQGGP